MAAFVRMTIVRLDGSLGFEAGTDVVAVAVV